MELKVETNMYIRLKANNVTYIRQIVEICEDKRYATYRVDKPFCNQTGLSPKKIIRASHDILDLIEVGDILHSKSDDEYWTVQEIQGTGYIQTEWQVVETQEEFFETFDEIITKEQAKEFSYKIGE